MLLARVSVILELLSALGQNENKFKALGRFMNFLLLLTPPPPPPPPPRWEPGYCRIYVVRSSSKVSKKAFAAAMQSWRERCEKCVCLQGDYVEK